MDHFGEPGANVIFERYLKILSESVKSIQKCGDVIKERFDSWEKSMTAVKLAVGELQGNSPGRMDGVVLR